MMLFHPYGAKQLLIEKKDKFCYKIPKNYKNPRKYLHCYLCYFDCSNCIRPRIYQHDVYTQ